MSARSSSGLQGTLLTQAGVTALFSFLPGNGTGSIWLVVQLALAGAAAATAWFVGTHARQAYTVALAFEGVALAVGVVGLTDHRYIPGTIIGIGALVRLLSNRGATGATESSTESSTVQDAPAAEAIAATAPIVDAPAFVPPAPLVTAGAPPETASSATSDGEYRFAPVSAEPAAFADAPSAPPTEPATTFVPTQPASALSDFADAYTQRMPVHSELTELAMTAPAEPEPAPAAPQPRAVVAPGRMAVDVLPGKSGKRGRR